MEQKPEMDYLHAGNKVRHGIGRLKVDNAWSDLSFFDNFLDLSLQGLVFVEILQQKVKCCTKGNCGGIRSSKSALSVSSSLEPQGPSALDIQ